MLIHFLPGARYRVLGSFEPALASLAVTHAVVRIDYIDVTADHVTLAVEGDSHWIARLGVKLSDLHSSVLVAVTSATDASR